MGIVVTTSPSLNLSIINISLKEEREERKKERAGGRRKKKEEKGNR